MAHRTARWLVAGACTIALASGLVAADARLTSLTHTRATRPATPSPRGHRPTTGSARQTMPSASASTRSVR